MNKRKVQILKCDHNDVQPGTIGDFVGRKSYRANGKKRPIIKHGIVVSIVGEFTDAYTKKTETKTEQVFVATGDYKYV